MSENDTTSQQEEGKTDPEKIEDQKQDNPPVSNENEGDHKSSSSSSSSSDDEDKKEEEAKVDADQIQAGQEEQKMDFTTSETENSAIQNLANSDSKIPKITKIEVKNVAHMDTQTTPRAEGPQGLRGPETEVPSTEIAKPQTRNVTQSAGPPQTSNATQSSGTSASTLQRRTNPQDSAPDFNISPSQPEFGDLHGVESFWAVKMSFINLKMWEDERYLQLSRQYGLLDNVCNRVFEKANDGKETNLKIAKFLRKSSKTHLEYSDLIGGGFQVLPDSAGPRRKPNLKKALSAIYNFESDLAAKVKHHGNHIEQDILQCDFSTLLLKYEEKVDSSLSFIEKLKKEVAERKASCIKFYQEHLVDFHNMEVATQTGDATTKCLWLSERNYLHSAKATILTQSQFANSVVMVWDEIKELEQMRMTVTKSVLMQYMKSRMALFSNLTSACEAYDIVGEYVPATNSLNPEKILTDEERKILEQETGVAEVRSALTSWLLSPTPSSSLIKKEGELEFESFENEWAQAWVVITRDSFIHMLGGPEETSELSMTFNLKNGESKVSDNEGRYFLELTEEKSGGLFTFLSSAKKIVFRFGSDAKREEWKDAFAI